MSEQSGDLSELDNEIESFEASRSEWGTAIRFGIVGIVLGAAFSYFHYYLPHVDRDWGLTLFGRDPGLPLGQMLRVTLLNGALFFFIGKGMARWQRATKNVGKLAAQMTSLDSVESQHESTDDGA